MQKTVLIIKWICNTKSAVYPGMFEISTTVYVKSIRIRTGVKHDAEHAMRVISEKTLTNRHQAIKRLIISFKIRKLMHGIFNWLWNGIHGKPFQKLKKYERVVMEPFFALKAKYKKKSFIGIIKTMGDIVFKKMITIIKNMSH